MGQHVCKFGDRWCGRWGYDDLCEYCKRAYDLELAQRENEMAGGRAAGAELVRQESNRALAESVAEHPVAWGIGALVGALGFGLAMSAGSKQEYPDDTKRPPTKRRK